MTPTTESQVLAFITRHRALLARERDAEVERNALLLANCGPKELEQISLGGLGIVGVNIGLGGKTLVELERPNAYHSSPIFPPHSFRPGDLARIEENSASSRKTSKVKKAGVGDAKTSKATEGVVYKVSDTRIVIAIEQSDSEDPDFPERCRVLKLANSVTYDRMDKTLDQLEQTAIPSSRSSVAGKAPHQLTRLIEVLLGMTDPSAKMVVPDLTFFDASLNSSQKEAVKFALESPEVACIHGPPGTGKTHTLIEIIRQLTSVTPSNPKSQRLLVCGASNLSVDNILERLLALPAGENGEKLKVTRIGHPARLMAHEGILESTLDVKASRTDQAALAKDVKTELESMMGVLSGKGKGVKGKGPRGQERRKMWEEVKELRKEYRRREGGIVKSVLSETQIVLATCHSSGSRQLQNLEFDVVLIDEATQALEAVCWIPILKAKKLILAGDPMQLPPTILSTDKDRKQKKQPEDKGVQTKASKKEVAGKKGKETDSKKKILLPTKLLNTEDKTPPHASSSDSEPLDEDTSDEDDAGSVASVKSEPKTVASRKQQRPGLRPPRTLETTLFDRLEKMYGPSIKRMLQVQYRMHSQICAFPSKVLYSSKLKSHESVASHLLLDLPGVKKEIDEDERDLLGTPVVFFDTAGCEYFERIEGDGDEGSKCNENEALAVKGWVDKLIAGGVLPAQIAIITPYQAQVALLTSLCRPIYGSSLEIGTVDGMQGREKDAIVISLVRSNETREVGFLKEKRRLNVAMTRAKRHLCIVGDSSTVRHGGPFLKKWLTWLEANGDVRYAGLE